MVPVALSDVIAVGEVPTAAEIEILAKAGFRSLLNTQPDGEVARFVTAAEAGALAEKAGLTYQHVPILSRRPDETRVEAFAQALAALPRPIYACCYSGARTAAAWALAAAPHHEPDSIVEACASAGFDIAFLRAALAERRSLALAPKTAVPAGTPAAAFVAKVGDVAAAAGSAVSAPVEAVPLVPLLKPLALLPRAATAGGFAVAG